MISFELTAKLKEAGFPQPWPQDEPYEPSLSELIEACGEKLLGLWREGKWWHAYLSDRKFYTKGKSPEEALAYLWLSIQE